MNSFSLVTIIFLGLLLASCSHGHIAANTLNTTAEKIERNIANIEIPPFELNRAIKIIEALRPPRSGLQITYELRKYDPRSEEGIVICIERSINGDLEGTLHKLTLKGGTFKNILDVSIVDECQ